MPYGAIEDPSVTAVIPVYNEEACLADCITSLREQDFTRLEIIAVDDGSQDSSREICRRLGVKVLEQRHKGPGAARNLGAAAAAGNILVFVDADMTFAKEYVSKLIVPVVSGAYAASSHWNEQVFNWDNPWARCQTWFTGSPDGRRQPVKVPERESVYRAVRKDFFLSSGGFDEVVGRGEDSSVALRTGVFAAIAPEAVCYHRNVSGPGEIFTEALWAGRSVVVEPRRRLRRCLGAVLLYHNPLLEVSKGLRLAVMKREPRMAAYAAIYSAGYVIGIAQALKNGFYHK